MFAQDLDDLPASAVPSAAASNPASGLPSISSCLIYADTNVLICPPGSQVVGAALRRKGGELGNRVAPRALVTNPPAAPSPG